MAPIVYNDDNGTNDDHLSSLVPTVIISDANSIGDDIEYFQMWYWYALAPSSSTIRANGDKNDQ